MNKNSIQCWIITGLFLALVIVPEEIAAWLKAKRASLFSWCLGVLVVIVFSGCAAGQYIGPSLTFSLGYEGITGSVTIIGKPSPTPAAILLPPAKGLAK